MTKYTVTVKGLNKDEFDKMIFNDQTFEDAIKIMEFFNEFYDYVCEYFIEKYNETI